MQLFLNYLLRLRAFLTFSFLSFDWKGPVMFPKMRFKVLARFLPSGFAKKNDEGEDKTSCYLPSVDSASSDGSAALASAALATASSAVWAGCSIASSSVWSPVFASAGVSSESVVVASS